MIILEKNFKWHLEAFASELFIYVCVCVTDDNRFIRHLYVLYIFIVVVSLETISDTVEINCLVLFVQSIPNQWQLS